MPVPLRVLILEDRATDAELMVHELRQAGYDPDWRQVDNEADYIEGLSQDLDIILADYTMPQFDAMRALKLLHRRGVEVPFIIVTGTVGEEVVAECMRQGATDYLLKDRLGRLGSAVERALHQKLLNEEKRQAEENLRSTNELLQALINAAPLAIDILDTQGRVKLWSPAAERLFGWKADEIIGRPLPSIPEAMKSRTHEQVDNELRGMTFFGLETHRMRKDGSLVDVQLWTSPLHDSDGEIIGSVGILADITERKKAEQQIQALNAELLIAYDETLEGWARALDLRDQNTEDHSVRVMDLTLDLARSLGIPEHDLVHVRRGALLHDIGKMGVPDAILLKPGPLTEEEWQVMRLHPVFAYDLLSNIPFLRPALDIPFCHHEKWDGSGYPQGLSGKRIPLAARIFTLVDVWDALSSDRPYRKKWEKEKVVDYIRKEAGTRFDPEITDLFLQKI